MASSRIALFLLFNVLFFTMVASNYAPCHDCSSHHPEPKCPVDALKLRVCATLLDPLVHLGIGAHTKKDECCGLIDDLLDLDAAVCLCTAIKANVLGLHLRVPVSLTLLLNACHKQLPEGFECEYDTHH